MLSIQEMHIIVMRITVMCITFRKYRKLSIVNGNIHRKTFVS